MDKKRYSISFLMAFKDKYVEPPVGFHPVYIKQKRVTCRAKQQRSVTEASISGNRGKGKWDNLEKIRAFTSSENSFIQRTRNRSTSEILVGEIRSLLNKVTDKTFESIIAKLNTIHFDEFTDDMINQTVKIYISKAIADRDYGILYADIGNIFHSKFKTFKQLLNNESIDMLNGLFDTTSINDIQKSKCIGFMRVLPFFIKKNILDPKIAQNKIINVICSNIDERKHLKESYAQITSTGGCGLYIELLCKFCEQLGKCDLSEAIDIRAIVTLLTELKGIKSIPARVRFMIEDTLDELKK